MSLRHLLALVLLAAGVARAQGAALNVITGVSVRDDGRSVVLAVQGSKAPNFTTFSMADPPRFVIDFSESRFQGVPDELAVNDGTILLVKNLSYGSDASSIARIMVAFVTDVDPPEVAAAGDALLVRIAKPSTGQALVAQREDAGRREREEAEARARAEAEAQARLEAEQRAREEAAAVAKAEREAHAAEEAQARAEAERRAAEEGARAAANVALEGREAEAARLAREEAEAARLAQEAEAQRREEERVALDAARDGVRQGDAQLAIGAPSAQLREIGFRQLPGVSRVFVRTSATPRFTIRDVGENTVRVELENTRIATRNDTRHLDTSFFPSAVALIAPSKRGSTYVVDIKLKQRVPYQQRIEGDVLAIDFERPGAPAGVEIPPAAFAPDAAAAPDANGGDAAN